MGIELGNDLMNAQALREKNKTASDKLKTKLEGIGDSSSDEELMEVCKEFEAYLVEKVMTGMRDAMTENEEQNGEYMKYFGDMMYQEYSKQIAENGELGLAKQLYESMKQNTVSPIKDKIQTPKE